jgi:hypothetical protein
VSRFVTSPKNIAGCVLAAGGIVLVVTDVVVVLVGVALIPVFYAIGALAAPARPPAGAAAQPDRRAVRRRLERLQHRTLYRLPNGVVKQVNAIAKTIQEVMPRVDTLPAGSPAEFVLTQCVTDYLPSALHAYLDLPRPYADHHVLASGKTPLQELSAQLELLDKKVKDIAADIIRADTDRLIVHGRFLAAKFGHGPLDITA